MNAIKKFSKATCPSQDFFLAPPLCWSVQEQTAHTCVCLLGSDHKFLPRKWSDWGRYLREGGTEGETQGRQPRASASSTSWMKQHRESQSVWLHLKHRYRFAMRGAHWNLQRAYKWQMNKREEERECQVAATFVTEHAVPCIVLCFKFLFLVWLVSTQWMIDLCLGADDELMKKGDKEWRRGDGKEAIKEEKEERIKRQAESGTKRCKSRRRSRRDRKRKRREESLTSFPKHEHLLYWSHLLITFESNLKSSFLCIFYSTECSSLWVGVPSYRWTFSTESLWVGLLVCLWVFLGVYWWKLYLKKKLQNFFFRKQQCELNSTLLTCVSRGEQDGMCLWMQYRAD